MIGGGNNNNIGNNINFNRNNFNNFNNFNRPGWGMGGAGWGNNWAGNWRNNYVNPNHWGWYHGCWGGHWGNNWWAPVAIGATAWGLGALTSSWGYGYGGGYSNPYYADSGTSYYDYSQPVSVANYGATTDPNYAADPNAVASAPAPAADAPPSVFDQARSLFMAGDYAGAQTKAAAAISADPKDPAAHEFDALCLFAQGDYNRSASVLNSLLAVAPGMDWTTMISLYPSQSVYNQQFSALEDYCAANPKDAPAHFVLAYHLLVRGEQKTAIDALQVVVDNQPKDQIASRMLAALKGESQGPSTANTASTDNATQPAVPQPEDTANTPPADQGPTTDLTGSWQAERSGDKFQLNIDENGQFVWKAFPSGGKEVDLTGNFAVAGDQLNLESKEQGVMTGGVKSLGADKFQFIPTGSPAGDAGLTFSRK